MSERIGYADIAAHYRRQIEDGALAPGSALPSMREVCEKFGVAITTANRAFRLLKAEGLTTPVPGVGTVVADRSHFGATGVARLDRLTRTGKEYAPGESSTGHKAEFRSIWDPKIADALSVELRDEVLIRQRVFLKDSRPWSVGYSYIHPRAVAEVPELQRQGQLKPFWQLTYKERTGQEIVRSPERRMARLAWDYELSALEVELPPGAAVAVLVTLTTFWDDAGPIEVWEDVYAPGSWQEESRPG